MRERAHSRHGAVEPAKPSWFRVRHATLITAALLFVAVPLGPVMPSAQSSAGDAGSARTAPRVPNLTGTGGGPVELAAETGGLASAGAVPAVPAALQSPLITAPPVPAPPTPWFDVARARLPGTAFGAGNIIADGVFYDTTAMTDQQISDFIAGQGASCSGPYCLRTIRVATADEPADRYCGDVHGAAADTAAAIVGKVSRACGINPQVMLVTLQKESRLLDRTDPSLSTYDAAWGWHCPDTGPDGTAACDPAYAGLFRQAYGMAKQWARYRLDPDRYHYSAGQTAEILYNVVESGCGSAPVTIANTATASLYNYTPYQPNAASLNAYPGEGNACSSYGNRNFFHLFARYFGSSGESFPAVGSSPVTVVLPDNRYVDEAVAGRSITVPNAAVARGLRAGFAALGMPYVWGGGGSGAGPGDGCLRGGGQYNSCGREIGFDCSGLTAYVLGRAGFRTPGDSAAQRRAGLEIGWDRALPGDIVGFPGHVAIYLGTVGGERYILEASWVGYPVQIVRMTRGDADAIVHRYWSSAIGGGADRIGARFRSTPRADYATPAARTTPSASLMPPSKSTSPTVSIAAAPRTAAPRTVAPRTVAPKTTTSRSSTTADLAVPPTSTSPPRSSSAPSSASVGSASVSTSTIPSPTTTTTTAMTATTPIAPTRAPPAPTTGGPNDCPALPVHVTASSTALPTGVTPLPVVSTTPTTEVAMTAFEAVVQSLTTLSVDQSVVRSDCGATGSDVLDN